MTNPATWLDRFFTASSITTAPYTQPSVNASVSVTLLENTWLLLGQAIFVVVGGLYTVSSINADGITVTLTNTGATGNASPGTVISNNSKCSISGLPGPAGAGTTNTSANFTQPAVNSTVNVAVLSSAPFAQNGYAFVVGGGQYQITAVPDSTHITLQNLGAAGNASPTTVINSGALVTISGPQGAAGSTGAAGAGPSGSTGIAAATGTLNSAGDQVAYNLPCATSNKCYTFLVSAAAFCTASGGLMTAGDSWAATLRVVAKNIAGTVTVVSSSYESGPFGDISMGQGHPGGEMGLSVSGISGTNVVCVVTGNGNNGVSPVNVRVMADSWVSS